jgi:type II secretion system protein I
MILDRRQGFSLIELVAAMAIFSVGVMACVELYSTSMRTTVESQDYAQAVLLAQAVMEETLAEGYLTATTDSGDFGDDHPRHSWELEVADTDREGLMKVQVTVKWNARNGEKQYELTTLHADRDVLSQSSESEALP